MFLFNRDEVLIATLKNIKEAKHTEQLNGEDTLELILLDTEIEKGYRIVYQDKYGYWKEFIVRGLDEIHAEDGIEKQVYCECSFYETIGDYLEDVRPQNVAANIALAQALVPTRWEVGQVDDLGLNSTNFYHTDAKSAVQNVAVTWGGELRTRIVISGNKIVHRYVDLLSRRGGDLGKRFTYKKDISEIKKTVLRDDVITALYGYGKGEEVNNGYGRRLDFASINGGKAYVENLDALAIWGRKHTDGTRKHIFGKVEFDDCTEPNELLSLTQKQLAEWSIPAMTYETKVYSIGLEHEQVALGDTAALIDKDFTPELRLKTRIVKIIEDLLQPENSEITFGNIVLGLTYDEIKNQKAIDNFKSKEAIYDRANTFNPDGTLNANYIFNLLEEFNTRANATGGYVFTRDGEGILTINTPDESTATMAIQILGGTIRIANTKNGDGSWNWTTALDGSGIIANVINAGVLQGGKVQFDLENGTLLIGNSITDYQLLWDGSKLWLNGTGIDSYATKTYVDTTVPHSIVFSNENQAFRTDTNGATIQTVVIKTDIGTYKGSSRIAGTVGTIQLKDSNGSLLSLTGITLTKGNPTTSADGYAQMSIVANTNLSVDSGYLEVPITIESKTYTKKLYWNKSKDGQQGIQGTSGSNGQSLYTWVKYADSPTSGMSDSPTGKLYIGLAYNKTVVTESNTYSDYTWSLIKGADGAQGPTGAAGADGTDGITYYTWIKYADDNLGNGMSDLPDGKRYLGLALNKTTATESTNPADYSWSPLYDNVQVGGRNLIIRNNEQTDMMVETDGTFTPLVGSSLTADFISVTAGESLAFSQTINNTAGDDYFRYAFYYDDRATVVRRSENNSESFIDTVPIGASWLRVSYDSDNQVKLEKGNIVTGWSEAPEDVQVKINSANDTANNAQSSAANAQATADSKADQTEVDTLSQTVSSNYSEWQQDSSGLHGQVGNIQTSLDSTNASVNKVYTYFDFLETGLNIGKSDSPLQINISNSEMDFLDNGKVIAYINGQKMYIDSLEVLSSLIVGNHKIEKYDSNITLVKWVG